jgi:hypothetical protein
MSHRIGHFVTLDEIANELSNRLIKLFLRMRKASDHLGALPAIR